jgi:hypothetical protein
LIATVAGRGNKEIADKKPKTKAVGSGYDRIAATTNTNEIITNEKKGTGEREYSVVFSLIFNIPNKYNFR